jgi:hypothetical protein
MKVGVQGSNAGKGCETGEADSPGALFARGGRSSPDGFPPCGAEIGNLHSVDDFGKKAVKNHPVIDRSKRRK